MAFNQTRHNVCYRGTYYIAYKWKKSEVVHIPKFAVSIPDYIRWKVQKRIIGEYPITMMLLLDDKGRL